MPVLSSYTLSTKVGRYLHPHGDPATWDSMGWAGGLQNSIEFAYLLLPVALPLSLSL